jgi:hypothetical protein
MEVTTTIAIISVVFMISACVLIQHFWPQKQQQDPEEILELKSKIETLEGMKDVYQEKIKYLEDRGDRAIHGREHFEKQLRDIFDSLVKVCSDEKEASIMRELIKKVNVK